MDRPSPDEPCCPSAVPTRRDFLAATVAAGSIAARSAATAFVAGPFNPRDLCGPDHFVPADKKLSAAWLEALTARGSRTWHAGADLHTIGIPIGGICGGQVYLTGDGRLVNWDVFNANANSGYGQVNYREGRTPTERVEAVREIVEAPPVDQGLALHVRRGGGASVHPLDATGFANVRFNGEYPLATVQFDDDDAPVRASLEAFSPFIPLDVDDSALPATVLRYTIENKTDDALDVTLAGWLENVVCRTTGPDLFVGQLLRRNRAVVDDELCAVVGGARAEAPPDQRSDTPPDVFATFDDGDYGRWTSEGTAFGDGPAAGTLPGQQEVRGFEGAGLVNTFLDGDPPQGRLVSPEFGIERPFISFLIGGGAARRETCINLVVDGEVVRSASGRDAELLRPRDWDVRDLRGKRAHVEIVDAASGPWGHINVDQIEFRDTPMSATTAELRVQPDHGTMCIAVVDGGDDRSARAALSADRQGVAGVFDGDGDLAGGPDAFEAPLTRRLRGAVARRLRLAPRAGATVTLVIAWHFPNLWYRDQLVGNHYSKRFVDALAVARYVARHLERLAAHTRLWHDTWYDSTLPRWLLDRVHSTAANLATATCQRWRNGRFWAWEGAGCCHGTCGHVWNYAHGLARLFPSLERSAREMQDFADGVGFDPATGRIGFRGEGWDVWAGDSQAGYVLKAWREHLCSADAAFLERNWPNVRKAVAFLIDRDAEGADAADGVLEGRQHNTYDIDYYGANTMVGSLYLAALRAAEEMGREVGDVAFANRCRALFDRGSRDSVERLFDREYGYFVQDVDLEAHPEWQYGDGCLADQLFGQSWAHQVGLGYVYPRDTVREALRSIWAYCWAPDVGPQNAAHAPERWFARPGEAGLFTCTWPKSTHLGPRSTRYRDEIWTGIEYQVAAHMAFEGMVTEALAMCRAIHDRYHPRKRNPWNEIECGDHYARSLASFGVPIALAGFDYHGPAGRLGFAPRITPDDFRCAFTAAAGWGTLAQRRSATDQTDAVELKWGALRLAELRVDVPDRRTIASTVVTIDGAAQPHETSRDGPTLHVTLATEATCTAGSTLELRIHFTQ